MAGKTNLKIVEFYHCGRRLCLLDSHRPLRSIQGFCSLGLLSKFDSICFLGDPGDPPLCFLLITIKGQLVSHRLNSEGASRTKLQGRES